MAACYGGRFSFKVSPSSGVLPGQASLLCRLLCCAGRGLQQFHGEIFVTLTLEDEGEAGKCLLGHRVLCIEFCTMCTAPELADGDVHADCVTCRLYVNE